MIKDFGLYLLKGSFFKDYPNTEWKHDKGGRPHFMAFRDSDGIFWMIPLSTQIEAYAIKIQKAEEKYGKGNCLFYHMGQIANTPRVFLISKMIPATEIYIDREYTLNGVHYVSRTASQNEAVLRKAKRYQALVKANKVCDELNIFQIKEKQLRQLANEPYNI